MPNREPLPAASPEDILKVLHGEEYETVLSLHELGKSLGCKIEAKVGATAYKITYSLTAPKKRVLFSIECNAKKWRVKANLFRIAQYQEQVQNSPESIKSSIKATRACVWCNPGCTGRASYEIDGTTFLPCYGSGHYFKDLSASDWSALEELIALESKA